MSRWKSRGELLSELDNGALYAGVVNLIVWAFSAGVVWTKLQNLEHRVLNGITTTLKEQGNEIQKIERRCAARHGED